MGSILYFTLFEKNVLEIIFSQSFQGTDLLDHYQPLVPQMKKVRILSRSNIFVLFKY